MRSLFLSLVLKAVQEVNCALCMGGGVEDSPRVIFERLQQEAI